MKKILFVFAAAAMMVACGNNEADNTAEETTTQQEVKGSELRIAFVLIDTLTNQYELYKEASDAFQKKQANAEATINAKGKSFATQVQDFQRKVQNNQLTQQQFESEQARLAKLQQDIEALQQRLSASLQEEYAKELQSLTDTIQNFMKSYAKEKGYDFILCKSSGIDNVLYGNPKYDITNAVVKALNKRYAQQKKAEEKEEKK
jgi:outer membrane protein